MICEPRTLQAPGGSMLESEDVRKLTDLGFLAMSRGLYAQAATIFEGVKAARPTQEAGFIGSALVQLAKGDVQAAIRTLRTLPPTDAAQVFLAIALTRRGDRPEARDILTGLLRTAADTPYGVLARVTLDELAK
jgi:Flp pilus assembly protein TadD